MKSPHILRAAFDLGSGASKLCIATVSEVNNAITVEKVFYGVEAEVLVGHAVNESSSKVIPDTVIAKLMSVLDTFDAQIRTAEKETGLTAHRAAIATAVYREAKNGQAVLDTFARKYNFVSARILSQDDEGLVGFLTGTASMGNVPSMQRALVWDSGGSSFQLTVGSIRPTPSVEFMLGGPWGSSKAFHAAMTQVQRKPLSMKTPNPMTVTDARRLIELISSDLKQRFATSDVERIKKHVAQSSTAVVGIGGPTCAHRMAWLTVGTTDGVVNADALEKAIETKLCGKTDAELAALGYPQVEMAISKMCLLVAVMRMFSIANFTFRQTTGTTLGMLAFQPLWRAPSKL